MQALFRKTTAQYQIACPLLLLPRLRCKLSDQRCEEVVQQIQRSIAFDLRHL